MFQFFAKKPKPNNDFFSENQLAEKEFNFEISCFNDTQNNIKVGNESVHHEQFCEKFKSICAGTAGEEDNNSFITPAFLKLLAPESLTYQEKNKTAVFILSLMKNYSKYLTENDIDKTFLQKQIVWIKGNQQTVLNFLRQPDTPGYPSGYNFLSKISGLTGFIGLILWSLDSSPSPHVLSLLTHQDMLKKSLNYLQGLSPEARQEYEKNWLVFHQQDDQNYGGYIAYTEAKLHQTELKIENEYSQQQMRFIFFITLLLLSCAALGYDKWQRSRMHPHTQRIANELNEDVCKLETKCRSVTSRILSTPQ